MKKCMLYVVLLASTVMAICQEKTKKSGWIKYAENPITSEKLGTMHDVFILKDGKGYRMYSSWYDGMGIGLSESKDGVNWGAPLVCLNDSGPDRAEDHVNRPVVMKKDGLYRMWYSDQHPFRSDVGYAVSKDGRNWVKRSKPVLTPTQPWEKESVMCSHVIWDEQENIFKMWYSAGDKFDPDAIGYATSKDGVIWEKHSGNPVFTPVCTNRWECAKVSGCQVIRRSNDYLMFYMGYSNPDCAQIGMARSRDGISGWERYSGNPIVSPGSGSSWDSYAVYKPFVMDDPKNNRWLLYYNGRCGWKERVGLAIHQGMNIGF